MTSSGKVSESFSTGTSFGSSEEVNVGSFGEEGVGCGKCLLLACCRRLDLTRIVDAGIQVITGILARAILFLAWCFSGN